MKYEGSQLRVNYSDYIRNNDYWYENSKTFLGVLDKVYSVTKSEEFVPDEV
jgi:hypothetical protein